MNKWYIYQFTGEDEKGVFTENHYYSKKVDKPHLLYVGTCEVSPLYFSAKTTKYYDGKEMHSRKDIRDEIKKVEAGSTLMNMLSEYDRLVFSYIPQLLKYFKPGTGGYYFPHKVKLK